LTSGTSDRGVRGGGDHGIRGGDDRLGYIRSASVDCRNVGAHRAEVDRELLNPPLKANDALSTARIDILRLAPCRMERKDERIEKVCELLDEVGAIRRPQTIANFRLDAVRGRPYTLKLLWVRR
jgi:hypothetical protein